MQASPRKAMKLVLLLLPAVVAAASGAGQQLTITSLGHAAVRVADDQIMLFVDFPYDPGSDFTPWDRDAPPRGSRGLCLVTHAHRDHFAPELADRYCSAFVGPKSMAIAPQRPSFGVEDGSVVEWKGLSIHAFASPHDNIEHYSYLVVWRGLRLFFNGDAEAPDALLRAGHLNVAFLTPRLLMTLSKTGTVPDADRVFSYHHRPSDPVPDVLGRIVLKPGQSIALPIGER